MGLLVLRPSVSSLLQSATDFLLQSATAFLLQSATSVITKCDRYYKVRKFYFKVRQNIHPLTSVSLNLVVTSSHDCHFPGSTHRKNLNFLTKNTLPISLFIATARGATAQALTVPPPMRESSAHRGLRMRIFYKGNIFFFSFIFIAKPG